MNHISRPLHRLLVCEGGRDPSLLCRLIDWSAPLLDSLAELTVLHIMSQIAVLSGVADWELEAEADELIAKHTPEEQLLESDLALMQQFILKLEAKVSHGLVVDGILGEAKSGDYDLVEIGAHQSRGGEHYRLDDLAHEIIGKVDRPVLVI